MRPTRPLLTFSVLLAFGMSGLAQESPPARPAPPEPHFVLLRYPADRDLPVAVVADQPCTLGDLVDHIDARHYPGFAKLMASRPEFQRYLQSDLIAPWVRNFADIKALEAATRESGIDRQKLDEVISATLKNRFQNWLTKHIEDRQKAGITAELTQAQVNSRLADFQLSYGLSIELQGWLDHLEPEEYTTPQLHEFFTAHARYFGGQVTIAHILIQHRDAGTGILLAEKGRAQAEARVADVRLRLLPDGSNFAEVARLLSEDRRTCNDGGVIAGIHRFDDRLPAELCRAAWRMKDGEVSDVVESRYGYHFLFRMEFNQHIFVLFNDAAMPTIKDVMRRSRQEDLLMEAREKGRLKLRV
jgi:hypothetical protein